MTPPHDLDIERSILADIFVGDIADYDDLTADDFYKTDHQRVFAAAYNLYANSQPVDAGSVAISLSESNRPVVSEILEIPPPADPASYSKKLKDLARLRKLLTLSNSITKRVYQATPATAESVIDYAQSEILQVGSGGKSGFKHISEIALGCVERCAELQQKGGITGVPSGYMDLDFLTCGFQGSDLILLAARPGMGKTALALNMLKNAAVDGHPVGMASLEMAGLQLGNRMLSLTARLNSLKFRSGKFDVSDFESLQEAAGKLSNLPIWIDDSPHATYHDLQKKFRRQKATDGLDLAVIDYLGFIDGDKGEGKVNEVQSISRALKALGKELDIPIILICQLSRACEQRGANKRPILSDLRDSGALEQDADIVMFLYRESVYDKEANPTEAELEIAKQRNGPTGTIGLYWEEKFTRFKNAIRR